MSIIFLKKRYFLHHWISLALVVFGVAIVGMSPIVYPDDAGNDETSKNPIFGLILILVGQIFAGFNMIVEEKLFRKFYIHPLQMVGWEGFWGLIVYSGILAGLQFLPCHDAEVCPYGTVEDSKQALLELGKNHLTWILALGSILSIIIYNTSDLAVIKYASCAQKATINTSKTTLVWVFFLAYPGNGHERFIWLQIVGFFLIIIGTLVYNEILVIPL